MVAATGVCFAQAASYEIYLDKMYFTRNNFQQEVDINGVMWKITDYVNIDSKYQDPGYASSYYGFGYAGGRGQQFGKVESEKFNFLELNIESAVFEGEITDINLEASLSKYWQAGKLSVYVIGGDGNAVQYGETVNLTDANAAYNFAVPDDGGVVNGRVKIRYHDMTNTYSPGPFYLGYINVETEETSEEPEVETVMYEKYLDALVWKPSNFKEPQPITADNGETVNWQITDWMTANPTWMEDKYHSNYTFSYAGGKGQQFGTASDNAAFTNLVIVSGAFEGKITDINLEASLDARRNNPTGKLSVYVIDAEGNEILYGETVDLTGTNEAYNFYVPESGAVEGKVKIAYHDLTGNRGFFLGYIGVEYEKSKGTSSIENVVLSGEKIIEGIYDLRGTRLDTPLKGICIIRYTDGSAVKVIVP